MDATLNYWNFCAALEAKGFRRVAAIEDILPKLGAQGRTAMVGYVFDEGWASANRDVVARFIAMTRAAKEILTTSDAEWKNIAPLTGAADDATLHAYRDRYREGIPHRPIADEEADARVIYRVLAEIGGRELSGRPGNSTPAPSITRSPGIESSVFCPSPCFSPPGGSPRCSSAEKSCRLHPPCWRRLLPGRSGALFINLGVTLARVALAFTLAMTLGTAIGYLMGRVRLADRLGDPWLILLLNLPALVVIVLAYIWARPEGDRGDRRDCHQQAAERRRHGARGRPRPRRFARRNGEVFAFRRWKALAARHIAATRALLRGRRPIAASRWYGRSCWLSNCWAARTASASRSASLSSCSISPVCSPIR